MFQNFSNLLARKSPSKGGPIMLEPSANPTHLQPAAAERRQTFSKVFRWRLADGHTKEPTTVEVAGSFNHWQKVPLTRDSALDAWHVTLHHIQGNKTHHYMILVDGKPVYDKNCDGLAIPHGPVEEQFQVQTDRGPRVFMLFAQTK
jgi:hypothetical protein